jgi:Na+/melibiose symporter-like transporter
LFYFGQQIAASISLLVTGTLIERYAGLQAGQSEPSASTIYRIGVLYGGLPAVLVLIAAGLILGYSLTRSRVRAIQRGYFQEAQPVESRSAQGGGRAAG